MIHDPKECRNYGTPDYQFYEFNDRIIRDVMCRGRTDGPARIPLHLGNFVRNYIEKNATSDNLKIIEHGDYKETDRLIRDALRVYAFMDPQERMKLHRQELYRLRTQLKQEERWAVY